MALEPLFETEPAPITYRRYLLLKQLEAAKQGFEELAAAWKGRRLELPEGDALPDGFPFKDVLASIGYIAYQDLVGATEDEFTAFTTMNLVDIRAVLDVFSRLPVPE